ncbi:serine/threonine-protein kinase 25 isoform X2, partial [Vespula maculifrons]
MFAAMVLHKHNKQNNGNNSNNHHHHHHQQQHHNNHHTRNNNTSGTSNNFNNNHINNNVSNVNQAFGARTIEWFLCLKSPFNARIVRAHTCCFLSGSKCVLLIRCCSFPSSPFRLMKSYVDRTKMKLLKNLWYTIDLRFNETSSKIDAFCQFLNATLKNPAVIRPIMLNARLTPAIGEINVRQIGCPIAWPFRFRKHHVASKTWPIAGGVGPPEDFPLES